MTTVELQREDVRNRLLRRADWRFLLPDPWPARSICFASGPLAVAVELISSQLADIHEGHDCDLAVAVDPNMDTLMSAWNALRAGGSCYTEWYAPLAGGLRSIRRLLGAVGFDEVTCYWAWPLAARAVPQFWLPLEAPSALRFFLDSRPRDQSAGGRAPRAALRAAWRLLLRLGIAWPVSAVARKPGQPAVEADPEGIGMGWASRALGQPTGQLEWLLLTGGRRSINKVVALAFDCQHNQPFAAIKMPRVAESIPALRREAATLRAVESLRSGGVPSVPRVLFYHEQGERAMLGETVVAGQPLYTLLRRANFRDLALKATDWLASLAERTELGPRAEWWNRLVEPVIADFGASFGPIIDLQMLRAARESLMMLGDLPLVCEQRDFSPWNVLVDARGELVVLDWESAEICGLPGLDLFYFLTYLAFFLDGAMESGRYCDSYRAMLKPSTFTGGVARACMAHYAERLSLDLSMLRPLRLLCWMIHARSEYRHFTADAGRQPGRDILRRSMFLSLWEEELRRDTGRW